MEISFDYKDIFKIFNKHKIQYLVVGGYAVIFYTEPRFTKDIDIWVKPDKENAKKVYGALKEFGAPLKGVSWETFMDKKVFYQVGMAPVRIDVLMSLSGISFDLAWRKRKRSDYAGTPINILGKDELIKSKKAAGRKQDELDVEILRSALRRKKFKKGHYEK